MSVELATGYVSLVPDTKGLAGKLKAGLVGPMQAAGKDAGKNVGESATKAAGGVSSLSKASMITGGALLSMGAAAVKFGIDAVKSAIAAETRQKMLENTIKNTGASYATYKTQIGETITKLKEQSAFSGGQLKGALTSLIRMTRSAGDGQKYLALSTDLARATGMDLETSAKLVGKVYNGNTAILKRYGIVVKEGSTATEALDQIQKAVAGSGAAYATTMQGSVDRMNSSWSALKTTAGQSFVKGNVDTVSFFATIAGQAAAGTLSWKSYMQEKLKADTAIFISSNKVRTAEQAQSIRGFQLMGQERQQAVLSALATQNKTAAIAANTQASLANTGAAQEALDAEYASEDASIGAARAHNSLKDAEKALKDAHMSRSQAMKSTKGVALDYREAVLRAKQADDLVAENSGGATDAIDALRRSWDKAAKAAGDYASKGRRALALKPVTNGGTHSGIQAAAGIHAIGPRSGYPATLHGSEVVVPLDDRANGMKWLAYAAAHLGTAVARSRITSGRSMASVPDTSRGNVIVMADSFADERRVANAVKPLLLAPPAPSIG